MKKLPITSSNYKYILESFAQWLEIKGYAEFTVYSMPIQARELFNWLERRNITEVKQITVVHIKHYYKYIKQRTNTKQGGALSSNHVNKHRQSLLILLDYLRQSARITIPYIKLRVLPIIKEHYKVLTVEEIKQLYEATTVVDGSAHDPETSLRDKAMLSILYGCGLRRREAEYLNVDDIDLDKQTLHVKHGKNYKERIVPISNKTKKDIEDYLYNARNILLAGRGRSSHTSVYPDKIQQPAFFISIRGQRMGAMNMGLRLKQLAYKTNNAELIEKEATLHTLRHSIATHLLANGMKIEKIAKFLGHSSLESTQIYTHLVEEGFS
jgi:integrase/recombinase XerD